MTENMHKANENVVSCNMLSDDELLDLLIKGTCPYEPEHLVGLPIGQFHCPVCGLMVIGGLSHPPIVWRGDFNTGFADYPDPEEGEL